MNDRELLELAAKAADLDIKSYAVDTDDKCIHLIVGRKFTKEKIAWNPLTDDGAALRLAVNLGVVVFRDALGAYCNHNCTQQTRVYFAQVSDHYAATRRAIVLAAADIGRNMEVSIFNNGLGTVAYVTEEDGTTVAIVHVIENTAAHTTFPANVKLTAEAPYMNEVLKTIAEMNPYDTSSMEYVVSLAKSAIESFEGVV